MSDDQMRWMRSDWRVIGGGLPTPVSSRTSGRRPIQHSHAYREILLCLDGRCSYGYRGRRLACESGTALFIEGGEEHDFGYLRDERFFHHLWVILSQGAFLAHSVTCQDGILVEQDVQHLRPFVEGGCDLQIYGLWPASEGRVGSSDELRYRLETLARYICCIAADAACHSDGPAAAEPFLLIKRHLDETAGAGDDLTSLSAMAGLSKYHFQRRWKAAYGCTVHEYIDACRRRTVERLLAVGTVKREIAHILGFTSPSVLSRWLRRQRIADDRALARSRAGCSGSVPITGR